MNNAELLFGVLAVTAGLAALTLAVLAAAALINMLRKRDDH